MIRILALASFATATFVHLQGIRLSPIQNYILNAPLALEAKHDKRAVGGCPPAEPVVCPGSGGMSNLVLFTNLLGLNNIFCCAAGEGCCNGYCALPGTFCCGDGVCNVGDTCCFDGTSCAPSGRVCCGVGVCPTGTRCCDNEFCVAGEDCG